MPARTDRGGARATRGLRRRLDLRRVRRLRPRVLRGPGAALGLPAGDAAGGGRGARPRPGRPDAAQVPGAAARRDHASAATIDVLRHGIKHGPHDLDLFYGTPSPGNVKAAGALRGQPLQRHPPASLQPRRDAARARPGPLHQRPAGRHLRAEEQPHQADGRGRGPAVQARPRPAREALRVRPLRGALRRGRPRGALLHAPEGQGLVVPALQPGLERRRGQSAQPERPQDRLPLEAHPHPRRA